MAAQMTDVSLFLIGIMGTVAIRFAAYQRDWLTVFALCLGMVHQTWLLLK